MYCLFSWWSTCFLFAWSHVRSPYIQGSRNHERLWLLVSPTEIKTIRTMHWYNDDFNDDLVLVIFTNRGVTNDFCDFQAGLKSSLFHYSLQFKFCLNCYVCAVLRVLVSPKCVFMSFLCACIFELPILKNVFDIKSRIPRL